MIYESASLPAGARLRADLCVVGSGAGGSMVAMVAAEAGLSVVVLEAGGLVTPGQMNQREDDMFPRLLWEAGGRTTADRGVKVHQGLGVGGSTLHNLNLCKRVPPEIRSTWSRTRSLTHLGEATWGALYDEVEQLLAVSAVPRDRDNRHNQLLRAGCDALGWRGGGLMHNRSGCVGSGFCEVGCSFDAKNNALKVPLTRAVRAGAEVLTHAQAIELIHDGERVSAVEVAAMDPATRRPVGRFRVDAARVCVSASATGTPALLSRSDIPDPSGTTGQGLRMHPAVVVAGELTEEVRAWEGIPQTWECTEWLRFDEEAQRRVWIVPAFAHPMGFATQLRGWGAEHRALMERYSHLAVFTAMVHDHTAGTVTPRGDRGVKMDYWPDAADREQLRVGAEACARLLLAAGAKRVFVPARSTLTLSRASELTALRDWQVERGVVDVTAVHPMATVAMDDAPERAAVDSRGRHHHIAGLWVGDASLMPSSIGVPPQLTTYALGLHVGRDIARSAGSPAAG